MSNSKKLRNFFGIWSTPKTGIAMAAAALHSGVPCGGVHGGKVYGSGNGGGKNLRGMLENREKPYVLDVRSNASAPMRD
ncbi:MAG: hypothetical protein ACREC0_02090 [Methylocella sp.]